VYAKIVVPANSPVSAVTGNLNAQNVGKRIDFIMILIALK
jgi:hypothetical protein